MDVCRRDDLFFALHLILGGKFDVYKRVFSCIRLAFASLQHVLRTISQQISLIAKCKSVRLWSYRLGFASDSGQTNDFYINIHSFPALRSVLKGQCGEQVGKFTCCAGGKDTERDSPVLVW